MTIAEYGEKVAVKRIKGVNLRSDDEYLAEFKGRKGEEIRGGILSFFEKFVSKIDQNGAREVLTQSTAALNHLERYKFAANTLAALTHFIGNRNEYENVLQGVEPALMKGDEHELEKIVDEMFDMIAEDIDRYAEVIFGRDADAEFCGEEEISDETVSAAEKNASAIYMLQDLQCLNANNAFKICSRDMGVMAGAYYEIKKARKERDSEEVKAIAAHAGKAAALLIVTSPVNVKRGTFLALESELEYFNTYWAMFTFAE